MKIIAGTGHRPSKLSGYKVPNPTYNFVCQQIEKILLKENPDKIISGMALGFDMWFAFVANKLKIPFIAAVPFLGQELIWPKSSQIIYHNLLSKALEKVIVSDGSYSPSKLQIRNKWMVDNCDKLIACFDGSTGGTANCIEYAKSLNKEILLISPFDYLK